MSPPPAKSSPLVQCEGLTKQFGARPLFDGIGLALFQGDRVGLVGPNGAGKSTLLKIVAGLAEADSGTRSVKKGVRIGYLAQEPAFVDGATVESALFDALGELAELKGNDVERHGRAARWLARIGFDDSDRPVAELSGGWKKRLAIARELARAPDVLLLDEPTNHLDLEGIETLEKLLVSEAKAFVVASHDRIFLENISRRMLELDRANAGGLLAVDGRYSDLLERRDELRRNQAEYAETLANRARRELEWLRRGPKARTTKSKARIDGAERLFDELAEVRIRTADAEAAGIDFAASGRRTKRLVVARGVGKAFDGRRVLAGIDLVLGPGTRLGVLGANGSGKSTLLALLAGALEPDEGTIERAPLLRAVRFEQGRETLDPESTLRRALAPLGDSVVFQGRELHVAAWARRFLFRGEQLDTRVAKLSGGERARILIARRMLEPADLLILDEPTNDLDIPTLEVLEESLLDFAGAIVLVTHDRYLLDRVSTSLLALDGQGGGEMFAELAQWQEARSARRNVRGNATAAVARSRPAPSGSASIPGAVRTAPVARGPAVASADGAKRLTYRDQREWDGMEAAIHSAEAERERRRAAAEDPSIVSDPKLLTERYAALAAADAEVERLFRRWSELETLRG